MLMDLPDEKLNALTARFPPLINVGCGIDLSIRELAEIIAGVIGFRGRLRFDTTKPDGTPKKLLDISKLGALGWVPRLGIREGIALACQDFMVIRKNKVVA